jgi:cyclin K
LQEETPKKCRDIIRKAEHILSSSKFASFGQDPKEEVITMERILLKTIKFDLQVDHPYRFLIEYAKSLKSHATSPGKDDSLKNGPPKEVVQKAWNFINDSLETTLCLQWEPEIIAVAMLYLACKISKFDVINWNGRTQDHQKWWDVYIKDMSKTVLDDICHQVLDLYTKKEQPVCPDSPPQLPPSKASPPLKRPRVQQPIHQQTTPNNIKVIGQNHIPVKVRSVTLLSLKKNNENFDFEL